MTELPWIDPTLGYPISTLREGVEKLEPAPYLAIRTAAAHKVMFIEPVHSHGLEHVDAHDWELFQASLFGNVDGREYYWGMFVEGLGMINVMVPKEFTRDLTQSERDFWSGRSMGMFGSHSGKLSYTFTMPVIR